MTPAAPVLIETIRVRAGSAPLFGLHLRRLVESCRALGVPFPGEFTVPGGEDRIQRLEVGPRGMTISERPVGDTRPVRLATSSVVHQPYPHKTTTRDQFVRAAEEARARGADEGLLLTARGQVAECGIWCLFWWEGDTLAAPALDLGVLRGVSRMRLEELAGPIAERRVGPEAIVGLPLFVANAARGVVPVAALDGQAVPDHPLTGALARQFWA